MGGSFACVWWYKHTIPKGGRLFMPSIPSRGYPGMGITYPPPPKCCFSDLKTGVSTFYRVLKEAGKLHHRSNARPPRKPYKPPELKATGPDQVYTWDITWVPSMVRGIFWYCYAIIDIWNREIVGWAIHEEESEHHARDLFESLRHRHNLKGTWVHSDNGNPMKGATFSVWLATLGMFLSHSRPLVKNDNPYIESFFRTLKISCRISGTV